MPNFTFIIHSTPKYFLDWMEKRRNIPQSQEFAREDYLVEGWIEKRKNLPQYPGISQSEAHILHYSYQARRNPSEWILEQRILCDIGDEKVSVVVNHNPVITIKALPLSDSRVEVCADVHDTEPLTEYFNGLMADIYQRWPEAKPTPTENKRQGIFREPTYKMKMNLKEFKKLKSENPGLTYEGLAIKASETLGVEITAETVRNTYRLCNEIWERGDRTR